MPLMSVLWLMESVSFPWEISQPWWLPARACFICHHPLSLTTAQVLMLYNRVFVHKQSRELYYLPVKHYLFNSEDKKWFNKERPWISKVQSLSKNLTWCRRRTSVTEQSLNNNMDYLSPWSLMCSAVCMNHMQSHPKHTLRCSDHSGSSWKQTRWKLNKSQVMCCPSEQVDLMLVKYCFYSSGWKFFPTSFCFI